MKIYTEGRSRSTSLSLSLFFCLSVSQFSKFYFGISSGYVLNPMIIIAVTQHIHIRYKQLQALRIYQDHIVPNSLQDRVNTTQTSSAVYCALIHHCTIQSEYPNGIFYSGSHTYVSLVTKSYSENTQHLMPRTFN